MPGRLATTLAARGAGNPEAFAAFLASRARDRQQVLGFAQGGGGMDDEGSVMTCPNCGYTGRDFGGGPGGVSDSGQQEALRTPAPGTGYVRNGAPLTVRGPSGSGPGLATPTAGGITLASPRVPVTTASDVLVARNAAGGASIRHRRGGIEIGQIVNDNGWKAIYGGKTQKPHPHQRGALAELISLWNTGTASLERPADPGLRPPVTQTPLMQQFGVPAINALATPSTGYSDGPRTTSSASSDSDDDPDNGKGSGLTPKGQAIKKKLLAKGWTDAKADMFARRAQSFGGSK
jgi:hypothetical protein